MDTFDRFLTVGNGFEHGLLGLAIVSALVELGFAAAGFLRVDRQGSPRRAVLVAALLSLPLLLLAWGMEGSIQTGAGPALGSWEGAMARRIATGAAGLLLALPLGVATCLWAGIAAARRSRSAGERARLSAAAAGNPDLGRTIARALSHSRGPALGTAIGLAAGIFVVGAPSLGLLLSGLRGLEGVGLLAGVDESHLVLLGPLLALDVARPLRTCAWIGAIGALGVMAAIGVVIHAGSSRRHNLTVAFAALEGARCPARAREQVLSALTASGKPGPWVPLLVAALLGGLAAAAWVSAGRLAAGEEGPSALAFHGSTGLSTGVGSRRSSPVDPPGVGSPPMYLLAFPDDVAIGGLEAQAGQLADETDRTIREAEALALSLLRGDTAWRQMGREHPEDTRAWGPRRVA